MQAQGKTQEIEELEQAEATYAIKPYEKKLIPNYESILQDIK